MFRIAMVISLLGLSVSFGQAQTEPGYLCEGFLPVEAPRDVPLLFRGLYFDSGLSGSGGAVTLANTNDKSIRYYVAIMEFLDDNGRYIVSAPVYNMAEKDDTIPLNVPFKPWLLRNTSAGGNEPITPGSEKRKAFNIALSTLTCPKSVRVSMVQLQYEDGTEFRYALPGLNLSLAPASQLELRDKRTARHWAPIAVSGTLQVDAEGRARILELDGAPEDVGNLIAEEIVRWKFIPAWVDGKPVAIQLPFLFFLGEPTHEWVQVEMMNRKGIRGPILVWPNFN
jgi:hypothetical protein